MAEDWIDEGVRQFTLALAWRRLAFLLEDAEPGPGLVRLARDFSAACWLPGVGTALEGLEAEWRRGTIQELPEDLNERLCVDLAAALEQRPTAAHDDPKAAAAFAQLFVACLASAIGRQAERPPEPRKGLKFPPEVRASYYLRQAAAVARWGPLERALGRQPFHQHFTRLAQECEEGLSRKVQGRRSFWSMGRGGATEVPEELLGLLRRCARALHAAAQALPDEVRRVTAYARRMLDRPPVWVPQELARWQAELVEVCGPRLDRALEELAQAPGEWPERVTSARMMLAWALTGYLDGLDQAEPLPAAAWARHQALLDRLCGAKKLRLIRGDAPAEWVERREDAEAESERVEQTGLVLHEDGVAKLWREARIVAPPPTPPLRASLDKLAQRCSSHDAELARLCKSIGHRPAAAPAAWWAGLGDDGKADLWRLALRAVNLALVEQDFCSVVEEVFDELRPLGVTLIDPPRPAGGAASPGPWFFSPDPKAAEAALAPVSWGRGVALRGPDGWVTGPAVWLRVPEGWRDDRPLVRTLAECEPLLAGLRRRAPDWPGWAAFQDANLRLAYLPAATPSGDEAEAGLQAFLAAYLNPPDGDAAAVEGFRELARRLYRCLTGAMKVALSPALDEKTLRPRRIDREPPDGLTYRWRVCDEPLGEVRVEKFGTTPKDAQVTLSTGPLSDKVKPWVSLPEPDFPGDLAEPHLREVHKQARALPWYGRDADARAASLDKALRSWLCSQGQSWFNNLAHHLLRPGGPVTDAARAWWRVVGTRCYPPLDVGSGRVLPWPADIKRPKTVTPEFNASVEKGQPVGEVVFAPSPDHACYTYSLGHPVPGGQLEAAMALKNAADRPPLRQAAETLLERALEAHLSGRTVEAPEQLAVPVLDELAAGPAAALAAMRQWAAATGLEVLPPEGARGDGAAPAGVEFSTTAPRGSYDLRRLGLRANGRVVREPEVTASAGPPPEGYAELLAGLDQLPLPKAAELAAQLRQWPEWVFSDKLRYEVAPLWKSLHEDFDGAAAQPHRNELESLRGLVRTLFEGQLLGLTAFAPMSLNDPDPNWIETRGNVASEAVRRVIRPGLRDGHHLFLKALVETE